MMRACGWKASENELKDLVSVIDQDGDGNVSFNEFVWFSEKYVM